MPESNDKPDYDLYNAMINTMKVYSLSPEFNNDIVAQIARYCGIKKTYFDFCSDALAERAKRR